MPKLFPSEKRRRRDLRDAYKESEAKLERALRASVEVGIESAPTWDQHEYDGILGVPQVAKALKQEFRWIRARLLYPCGKCRATHTPDEVRGWIAKLSDTEILSASAELHRDDVQVLKNIKDDSAARVAETKAAHELAQQRRKTGGKRSGEARRQARQERLDTLADAWNRLADSPRYQLRDPSLEELANDAGVPKSSAKKHGLTNIRSRASVRKKKGAAVPRT